MDATTAERFFGAHHAHRWGRLRGLAMARGRKGGGPGPGHFGPPWAHFGGAPGFGGGPFRFGGWGPGGTGRRMRRGDVRSAILALLAEEPRNGYQVMQEIEERSQGLWRPSAGAVYPALQQLEDEGLVTAETSGGGRVFTLTDAGKTYAKEHADELAAPWQTVNDAAQNPAVELFKTLPEVARAAVQVGRAGTEVQVAEARRILERARRDLYRLLAGDAPAEESESSES